MKKIEINNLEYISGGAIKCGWIGLGAAASLGLFAINPLVGTGAILLVAPEVVRCWNI